MTVTFVTALYPPKESCATEKYLDLGTWLVTAKVSFEATDVSHVRVTEEIEI